MPLMSAQSLPSLVAVTHQAGGDRVAVGLVVDQDATERVAGGRVERLENDAEDMSTAVGYYFPRRKMMK